MKRNSNTINRDQFKVGLFICFAILAAAIYLPYCENLSSYKVNETSISAFPDIPFYETTFWVYEIISGQLNLAVILLISLVMFLAKKPGHKLFLIPIAVIYYLFTFVAFIAIRSTGWGAVPHGGTILAGFYLMLIGTTSLFLLAMMKPLKETTNNSNTASS